MRILRLAIDTHLITSRCSLPLRTLAADRERARWNRRSVSSGQLATEYGFTDTDGSRPGVWRYMKDEEAGARDLDPSDCR